MNLSLSHWYPGSGVVLDFIIYLQKYTLILTIFLHKNTKSCITILAFSDPVSPSSTVYPRRTTYTGTGNGPESESNINNVIFPTVLLYLNLLERKTQRLSAL